MKNIIALLLFVFATKGFSTSVTLQCGDEAFLNSVKVGNVTVDFATTTEATPNPSEKIKALAHITRVALLRGMDPYALMALDSVSKNSMEVGGLQVARTMECTTRVRTDMKHFSAKDIGELKSARDKLWKATNERSRIKGGDDYDEWLALQKDVEKQMRANDELKTKMSKLTGDKKEEAQDQLNDNNEEIKGLKLEQEDYTKSPEMKKIIALEAQRFTLRQQIEGIRIRVAQAALENQKEDVSREFECLKSDECLAVLLKNEKTVSLDLTEEGLGAGTESSVCLAGETIAQGNAEFTKGGGTCCAKVKVNSGLSPAEELSYVAAAQGLKDTFASCTTRPAENDCFAKYLEFKGPCAHAHGTKVAVQLISEFLANTEVNSMVAVEAKKLKKSVISSFCVGQKKKAVTVEDGPFIQERKKFISLHKACGK